MRDVPTWDDYFTGLAAAAAGRSKDPATQVGTAITSFSGHIVSLGYNGFPPGVQENAERWMRPEKYDWVLHSEMNAIAHAARQVVGGGTLYCTHHPCQSCAKLIVASGIRRVVAGQRIDGWNDEHAKARLLMREAGVEWR